VSPLCTARVSFALRAHITHAALSTRVGKARARGDLAAAVSGRFLLATDMAAAAGWLGWAAMRQSCTCLGWRLGGAKLHVGVARPR
jgi:hypothetical protein